MTCILFGLAATAFWLWGLKQGVMFPVAGGPGRINRRISPVAFWVACVFYGIFAWGLLVLPVLSLLGWRR